jgi:EAL domain-containing protein (putative c-di-GMP-specific phosphodiesterase class I)
LGSTPLRRISRLRLWRKSCQPQIDTDSETSEIVRVIITLAHNLGLKVTAEGAETAEQVSLLKELKCEFVQGYFFARPGDHATAQALLMRTYVVAARPSPIVAI